MYILSLKYNKDKTMIKKKINNTTPSEQFQNPIGKSQRRAQ